MDYFQRNLSILKRNQPKLAELVSAAPDLRANAESSPDGLRVWRTQGSDGPWIHSRRAPAREVERILKDTQAKPEQPVMVLGVGTGLLPLHALVKYRQSVVCVLEHNVGLIRSALSEHDYSDALTDMRLSFALPLPGIPIGDTLTAFADTVCIHGYQMIRHAYASDDRPYIDLFKAFAEWARSRAMELQSGMHGGGDAVSNLMYNIYHFAGSAGINDLRGVLKDVPAVMIGAGPSLERNIQVLKELGGRAYVHAVSSALKRVLSAGVQVHSTNVVDWSHLSQRYFTDIPAEEAPVLWAHPRCHYSVLEGYSGELVTVDDSALRGIFREDLPNHGSYGYEGNNVAHYAYATLRTMGCNPIILVGMDLAFSFHNTHVPGTAIHDEWAAAANPWNCLETQEAHLVNLWTSEARTLEDAYGNPLISDAQFDHGAATLERIIERDEGVKVFNCTEGGRTLKHTENKSLREVLESLDLGSFDTTPVDRVLSEAKEAAPGHRTKALEILHQANKHGNVLRELYEDARRLLRKAQKALVKGVIPYDIEAAMDKVGAKVNQWKGLFDVSTTWCAGDMLLREKKDAEIFDESKREIERYRILTDRELNYIKALGHSLDIWQDLLKRSIARMEAMVQGVKHEAH